MTPSVLIVDDHPLMSNALATVLRDLYPRPSCAIANSAALAKRQLMALPDLALVILDLSLPDMDGFDLLSHVRERYPDLPVMVVSASENPDDVKRAMAAGARAYVSKSAPSQELLKTSAALLRGDRVLPSALLAQGGSTESALAEVLNARQLDVLRLVCAGKSNKVIAYELGLAEKTVKGRITAIFKALDVDNRTQALIKASKLGLVTLGEQPAPLTDEH